MLPLAELVGCSCPRAPAPPLLVLYWYPPGKRRKGVSRRRQVRAYLAESRSEAERWAAAVQCLLRDVTVTADTGEIPPPVVVRLNGPLYCLFVFNESVNRLMLAWIKVLPAIPRNVHVSLTSVCPPHIPEESGSDSRQIRQSVKPFWGMFS